jgi:hypothetical protein
LKVLNRHARRFDAEPEKVGACLDSLASRQDLLWPGEQWPAMAFDKPLGVGARGGHGPIRYSVEEYQPAQKVVFRFTSPKGFDGTHTFEVEDLATGCELRHTIDMRASGPALLTWPLLFRPLHDALLEDGLDKVEAHLRGREWHRRKWSPWVRFLRGILGRRRRARERRSR